MENSSNETKECGYVISLMKLRVKDVIFPIKTLSQVLR